MKVDLLDVMGADLTVVNAARVSYDNESFFEEFRELETGVLKRVLSDRDKKLIKFLAEHGHIIPFAHPQLSFRIHCPIFVMRQLDKTRVGLCLSGDTLIHVFGRTGRLKKIKISDVYDMWINGFKIKTKHKTRRGSLEKTKKYLTSNNFKLRSYDEINKKFIFTNLNDVLYNGKKEVYEIELVNGNKIKATSDHLFYTGSEWLKVEDLAIGDVVGCNGKRYAGDGKYQQKQFLLEAKNKFNNIQHMADYFGCKYPTIRKWLKIHKIQFDQLQNLSSVNKNIFPWNKGLKGYKIKKDGVQFHSNDGLIRIKNARAGANSNFWKGGTSKRTPLTVDVKKQVYERFKRTCQWCYGNNGKMHVHHIVPVYRNPLLENDLENLCLVHENCHKIIHSSIENENILISKLKNKGIFTKEKDTDKKRKFKGNPKKIDFIQIRKIKKIGIEDVFDISIDHPSHNFIANGIITHNCVSEVSRRYISSIPDVYQPVSWRKKDKNKKQGSSKTETIVNLRPQGFKMQTVDEAYQRYVEHSLDLYKDMLDANICEEQARMVLPLGSYTTFIWTGSLLAFCRLVNLRLQDDAQEETAIIVRYILKFLKDKFPIASGQLTKSKINYEQWEKYYEQVGIED